MNKFPFDLYFCPPIKSRLLTFRRYSVNLIRYAFSSVLSNLVHVFSEFSAVHYFTAENVASDHLIITEHCMGHFKLNYI